MKKREVKNSSLAPTEGDVERSMLKVARYPNAALTLDLLRSILGESQYEDACNSAAHDGIDVAEWFQRTIERAIKTERVFERLPVDPSLGY